MRRYMVYYKVPKEMDNVYIRQSGYTLVQNELLTLKQVQRMGVNINKLERVEISSRKTYWCFGCRFEM